MPRIPLGRRGRFLLILAGIAAFAGLVCWLALPRVPPGVPSEYRAIALGMTKNRANGILTAGTFRPFTGPGFSGTQKDEQYTRECADLRSDAARWHQLYRIEVWRSDDWSISLTFDSSDVVAGKTLVLIDHGEFSFFRNPVLWIKRRFAGPVP
jgi:hypothetical protein